MNIDQITVSTMTNVAVLIIGILLMIIPISPNKKNGLFFFTLLLVCSSNEYFERNRKIEKPNQQDEGNSLILKYDQTFLNMTKQLNQSNPIIPGAIQLFHSTPRSGMSSHFKALVYDRLQNNEIAIYIKVQGPIFTLDQAYNLIFAYKNLNDFIALSKTKSVYSWIVIDNLEKSIQNKECFLCEVLNSIAKSIPLQIIILVDNLETYPQIKKNLPNLREFSKFQGYNQQAVAKNMQELYKINLAKEDYELMEQHFSIDWLNKISSKEMKSYKEVWQNQKNQLIKSLNTQQDLKEFIVTFVSLSCLDECQSIEIGLIKNKLNHQVMSTALSSNLIRIKNGQVDFFDDFYKQAMLDLCKQ